MNQKYITNSSSYILGLLLFALFGVLGASSQHKDSIFIEVIRQHKYIGSQIYPKIADSANFSQTVDSRVFRCFKMSDTLIVVTDNPLIWQNKYSDIKRYDFRKVFKHKTCHFNDEDLPYCAYIYNKQDTLLYTRVPNNKWDYQLEMGKLESFSLVKVQRNIYNFCELIGIRSEYIENIRWLYLLHPEHLAYTTYPQYIVIYPRMISPNIIQIEINNKRIKSITFDFTFGTLDINIDFESYWYNPD